MHAADARRAPEEVAILRRRLIVGQVPYEAPQLPLVGLDPREVVERARLEAEGDPLVDARQRNLERDAMGLRRLHRRPVELVVLGAARLERHVRAVFLRAVVAEAEV